MTVNNKWFLKERAGFEEQFNEHVGADVDESLMSSVYFSEKEKKMVKRRAKLIKRNAKKNRFALIQVTDFKFTNIVSEE